MRLGDFCCLFPLRIFVIKAVVCILCGLDWRNLSGLTSGLVIAMLGTTFHLFLLSIQAPIYYTEENRNSVNPPSQKTKGSKPLYALIYKENPNHFYPQELIVKDPMPITSNISESKRNDSIVFLHMGKDPVNFDARAHGNASSTSLQFLT